jgi:hypothetical protein
MMSATIAAEDERSNAVSRSYSYVYQAIWHYLWYWGVAIVYGAALIFFVGFMGSLVVYMGKGASASRRTWSTSPAAIRRTCSSTRRRRSAARPAAGGRDDEGRRPCGGQRQD